MRKTLTAALALGAGTLAFCAPSSDMVWKLGTDDGAGNEFQIPYHAWEYGNAPAIRKSPAMDHKTHTFRYTIPENRHFPKPAVVSSLYTVSERQWMENDEIVSNLALRWKEGEGGRRLLQVKCFKWSNQNNGVDGIEILLPGGKKKVLNLPAGNFKTNGPFSFDVVFDAVKGENTLEIRNVSLAKHYYLAFDSITLSRTDRKVELPPVIEPTISSFSGIAHPGDPVKLKLQVFNADGGTAEYEVSDFNGKIIHRGKTPIRNGEAQVSLPSGQKGYFSVACRYGGASARTSYVVVEPVKAEFLPDSRFGCHALAGDGYRIRRWPEREELKMHRAFLGGAKWARMHSLSWALREPKKGTYDWRGADERFALAEKYKMKILLAIGQTPRWSSPSRDMKLTVCGNYSYLYYPPQKYEDWAVFVTKLVQRYKDRVSHFEIGNEPGYASAFWTCGSAPAFGKYLKTAYDAIKKVYPEATVYPGAPLNIDFLEEAVRSQGGAKMFDVLSIHYLRNEKRGSEKTAAWRSMLKNMGNDQLPVNSEDMGWIRAKDPRIIAANVVKVHIRDASQGVIRTFGFEMFDDNSSANYSFFDRKDNPLPQFPAYRTMTHRLERSKYIGNLSGAEYEAYLFDRQGTPVTVFWSDKGRKIHLPVGKDRATLVDLMDTERSVPAKNGIAELPASEFPQYLEGGDGALLKTFAETIQLLPGHLILKKGEKRSLPIRLPESCSKQRLQLPDGWTGGFSASRLDVKAPANAAGGVYDGSFHFSINGTECTVPLILEILSGNGGNLIPNGDFEKSGTAWFYPKEKAKWDVLPKVGFDDSAAVRSVGANFFGPAGRIKVREGERYLLAYDVRGEGSAGVCYSILDQKRKTIFPAKPGINALSVQARPEWKRVSEIISINQPGAAYLSFAILTNYGDKTGKTLYLDNVTVGRLTERSTVTKILNRGSFTASKGEVRIDGETGEWAHVPPIRLELSSKVVNDSDPNPWKGPADLSGSARMMLDSKNLYLLSEVRDDRYAAPVPISRMEDTWQNDSIQFGIDPFNDGCGYTELLVGQYPDGRGYVFKHQNYWTPELPENITRRGLLKDAETAVRKTADGMVYEIRIPLRELYPLSGKEDEIGFNFLINDNDGNGRKYIEWAGGIGKNKKPSEYGLMQRKK